MYSGYSVDHRNRLYRIDEAGAPHHRVELPTVTGRGQLAHRSIIMVHGFNYDPTTRNDRNPHRSTFREWGDELARLNTGLDDPWDIVGFGWYSGNPAPAGWPRAWANLSATPYTYAWHLAQNAAEVLAKVIGWGGDEGSQREPEIMLVAHSLGTRLVVEALRQLAPDRVAKTLLLNGAEYSQNAAVSASYAQGEVLNIKVRTDAVLDLLGENFAPGGPFQAVVGRDGLLNAPAAWLDFPIDDDRLLATPGAAGYPGLAGDNPQSFWDHSFSHVNPANWHLYRDFLAGHRPVASLRDAFSLFLR